MTRQIIDAKILVLVFNYFFYTRFKIYFYSTISHSIFYSMIIN